MGRAWVVVSLIGALTLAGCGGTSGKKTTTSAAVTVGAYGGFAATTIPVTSKADARVCTSGARGLAQEARDFLAHSSTQAAYPADLNFEIIRDELATLAAQRCAPAVIGKALQRGLTSSQRRALLDGLPSTMAATLRTALAQAGSG